MRIRATVEVEYELPAKLTEAYGTEDHNIVLALERGFLDGDDGQGDYLMMQLEGADVVRILKVEELG